MADIEQKATSTVYVNGEAAKQELEELTMKTIEWSRALDQAEKDGNKALGKQLNKLIKEANKEMNGLKKETVDVNRVLSHLSTSKPKELSDTIRILNSRLNSKSVTRNSAEWNTLTRQISLTRNELARVNSEMQLGQSFSSRMASGANKYFGAATAAIAGLTGVGLSVDRSVDKYTKMTDVYSDVEKYTGMTTERVAELNEEFKKMDTRTTREQLNALANDAGRLGLKTKEEILDFVEGADIIKVALGEDLGEDAVKNIGKMAEMFGISDEKGLKQGMLSTASAINEIGQSSSASEQYLLDFTARMAGTGKVAGISMTQIMGYASVLDQDMQQVEMSSTALQGVVMKMYQDPAKFANMAGKDVTAFTKLLKEDANEALLQLLSTLKGQGGLEKLAPIFKEMNLDGARASGVLSNLATNVDKIRSEQTLANKAFEDGTSVINEFTKNNTNAAAEQEKARKVISDQVEILGKALYPAYIEVQKGAASFLTVLVQLPKFFSENKQWLYAITAAIAAYNVVLIKSTALKYYHIAAEKLMVMWTNRAAIAHAALNLVIKANPIGFVITLIAALVAVLITLYNNNIKVQASIQGLWASLKVFGANVSEMFTGLWDIISGSTNFDMDRIKKGFDSMKKSYSKFGSDISEAYSKAYNERMQKHLDEQEKIREKEKADAAEASRKKNGTGKKGSTDKEGGVAGYDEKAEKEAAKKKKKVQDQELKDLQDYYELAQSELKKSYLTQQISKSQYEKMLAEIEITALAVRVDRLKSYGENTGKVENELLEKRLDFLQKYGKKLNVTDFTGGVKQEDEETDSSLDAQIEKWKTTYSVKQDLLVNDYEKGLITQQEYQEAERRLLQEHLEMKLQAYMDNSQAINDISNQAGDLVDALQQREELAIENKYAKELKAAKGNSSKTAEINERMEQEKKEMKKKYADVDFMISAAQIVSSTAMGIMNVWSKWGWNPAVAIPMAVLIGLTGAAQLAVSNEQRKAVKNMWTGGFTPSGAWNEEQGIVHSNEFVANRFAVANPSVRRLFNVIDQAQRNNTVSTLNDQTIAAAMGFKVDAMNATRLMGGNPSPSSYNTVQDDQVLVSTLAVMAESIQRLNDRLDDDIVAVASISGNDGVDKKQKDYNRLIKNVSR